jgi:hypothetical protein
MRGILVTVSKKEATWSETGALQTEIKWFHVNYVTAALRASPVDAICHMPNPLPIAVCVLAMIMSR